MPVIVIHGQLVGLLADRAEAVLDFREAVPLGHGQAVGLAAIRGAGVVRAEDALAGAAGCGDHFSASAMAILAAG
jgi:hypothetical protein